MVAGRKFGIFEGPGDIERWVVPSDDFFGFWRPWGGNEVGNCGRALRSGETMCEAFWKENLRGYAGVLRGEGEGLKATKGGGAFAQVEGHIEDGT